MVVMVDRIICGSEGVGWTYPGSLLSSLTKINNCGLDPGRSPVFPFFAHRLVCRMDWHLFLPERYLVHIIRFRRIPVKMRRRRVTQALCNVWSKSHTPSMFGQLVCADADDPIPKSTKTMKTNGAITIRFILRPSFYFFVTTIFVTMESLYNRLGYRSVTDCNIF